jgi:pyruvate dehydrogenase E2 component (dihydrolipoamide acetyltransferase)
MADFLMPSLGADMESGTLTEWYVKPGDTVSRGETVAAVETAKGIIDIEIFEAGTIESLVAQPDDIVPVGGVLARYSPAVPSGAHRAAAGAAAPAAVAPTPAPAPPATPPPPGAATGPGSSRGREPSAPAAGERRLVSPAARKRAAELGVDLAAVPPSGPGGAVTLQDVERAAQAAPRRPADMRAVIGQAMSRSKREIPHYYLATTIDMTRAMRWLEAFNAARPVTERLLYGVLLLKAVALALAKTPDLNGFWRDGRFEPSSDIHVGAAVRLRQGGLVAPALADTESQSLPDLMRQFQDAVQRARAGRLRRQELTSATITVSSLGEGSAEVVYPIINPPQVAIVGFGSLVERPWCVDGAVVAAPLITASLAADHRVTDGHRGSQFLVEVSRLLQRPEEL